MEVDMVRDKVRIVKGKGSHSMEIEHGIEGMQPALIQNIRVEIDYARVHDKVTGKMTHTAVRDVDVELDFAAETMSPYVVGERCRVALSPDAVQRIIDIILETPEAYVVDMYRDMSL